MTTPTLTLIISGTLAGVAGVAILAWFLYTAYLNWFERRPGQKKGMYRELVEEFASGGLEGLDGELHRPEVLKDLGALEAALEGQDRRTAERLPWLLDAFDRTGLIDKYVQRLGSAQRWSARALAAELLGRVGNATAVPALLDAARATRTEDAGLRDIALRALGRIADPRAIAPLTKALESAEPWLAPHITGILMRHGDSAVRGPMLRALRRARRPDLATEIVLVALADPGAPAAARAAATDACARLSLQGVGARLLDLLSNDPSSLVRERAAVAVGLLAVPGGEAALVAAHLRPEPSAVHAATLLATGMFDQESLVARLAGMPDSTAVQESLRDRLHHDPWFRLLRRRLPAATRPELRAIATHTVEAAGAVLARGMDETLDPGGRIRLIGGLGALQGEESREALTEAARHDPSPEARTASLAALGGLLHDDDLLSVARRALADPSLLVRRAAVTLFSRVPPELGLPVLIRSLKPGDDPAVFAAVADLAAKSFRVFADLALRMTDDGAEAMVALRIARTLRHPDLPRLLPLISRSRSPEVREEVAALWRERPETTDAESVATLILDPSAGVRRAAARAAGAIRSWSLLARLAIDPDSSVRRETALAAGVARDRTAEADALLEELAGDNAMPVRAAAYAARLVQGIPLPPPPGIAFGEVAASLRESADLAALHEIARTASDGDQRLAAGFALAMLDDHVAREVARTDPSPSIRHRVGGALELAAARRVRSH